MKIVPLEKLDVAKLIKLFSNFVESKDLVERYTMSYFISVHRNR
jgi:hypothetical protein